MTRGDEVPEWAKKRMREEFQKTPFNGDLGGYDRMRDAFARYIAQHEEPPVDPLVSEALAIASEWYSETAPNIDPLVAALKRGMELAKERQP